MLAVGATVLSCYSSASSPAPDGSGAAAPASPGTVAAASPAVSVGWTDHVARRLEEKSAAMAALEERVKVLSTTLAAREQELTELRRSSSAKNQEEQSERRARVVKVYRALKPEEAARLLDKLDEGVAMELLEQMDQKTIAKLVPHLNQPRFLKWTRTGMGGTQPQR
jgi:Fic family protein